MWLIYSFFNETGPSFFKPSQTSTGFPVFSKKNQDIVPYTVANGPYYLLRRGSWKKSRHSARWIPQGCAPVQIGIWSKSRWCSQWLTNPPPPKKKKSCIRESPILFQGFTVNGLSTMITMLQFASKCYQLSTNLRVLWKGEDKMSCFYADPWIDDWNWFDVRHIHVPQRVKW